MNILGILTYQIKRRLVRYNSINPKLLAEVESRHPRLTNSDGTLSKYPICKTDVGCFGLKLKNDIEPLGLGMVIYFKVLKAFSILFFIVFLINIPMIYIFTSSKVTDIKDYNDAIFRTTLGNVASGMKHINLSLL